MKDQSFFRSKTAFWYLEEICHFWRPPFLVGFYFLLLVQVLSKRERERDMCDINTYKADPSCIRPAYAMQCMELPEPGCLLPSRFTYLQKNPKNIKKQSTKKYLKKTHNYLFHFIFGRGVVSIPVDQGSAYQLGPGGGAGYSVYRLTILHMSRLSRCVLFSSCCQQWLKKCVNI